jgi:hypothetical protein
MSIIFTICDEWFLPFCNFNMPFLFQILCFRISVVKADVNKFIDRIETLESICRSDMRVIESLKKTSDNLFEELKIAKGYKP